MSPVGTRMVRDQQFLDQATNTALKQPSHTVFRPLVPFQLLERNTCLFVNLLDKNRTSFWVLTLVVYTYRLSAVCRSDPLVHRHTALY